jgi:hypothetical protein
MCTARRLTLTPRKIRWAPTRTGERGDFCLERAVENQEENFPQVSLDLQKAVAISTIIQKPFWNALFFCLLALLKKHAEPIVTECLSGTPDYYWDESKRLFGFLCLDYEVEAYAQLEELLCGSENRAVSV